MARIALFSGGSFVFYISDLDVAKVQEKLKKSKKPPCFGTQPGVGRLSPIRGLEVCLDVSQRWV